MDRWQSRCLSSSFGRASEDADAFGIVLPFRPGLWVISGSRQNRQQVHDDLPAARNQPGTMRPKAWRRGVGQNFGDIRPIAFVPRSVNSTDGIAKAGVTGQTLSRTRSKLGNIVNKGRRPNIRGDDICLKLAARLPNLSCAHVHLFQEAANNARRSAGHRRSASDAAGEGTASDFLRADASDFVVVNVRVGRSAPVQGHGEGVRVKASD